MSVESLDSKLLIKKLDKAKRDHYEFLSCLDLSKVTTEQLNQDQLARESIAVFDAEIRKRHIGEFVSPPSWAV